VLHYTLSKDIKALSALAEVNALEGSCTHSGHFFCDTRQPGELLVREVACLNCAGCSVLDFANCENMEMCGPLHKRQVKLKSGGRAEAPHTRSAIQLAGYERAKSVTPGMCVGSENARDQEPWIVSVVLEEEHVWVGPDGSSWNGTIKAGDRFIKARKLHHDSALRFLETDTVFYLNSEDVRVVAMRHETTECRRTRSNMSTNVYKLAESEVELLKQRVHI
jgi:hypothetical protein